LSCEVVMWGAWHMGSKFIKLWTVGETASLYSTQVGLLV